MPAAPSAFPVTARQLALRHARALGAAEACIKGALIECRHGRIDRARIYLETAQEEIEACINGKGEAEADRKLKVVGSLAGIVADVPREQVR